MLYIYNNKFHLTISSSLGFMRVGSILALFMLLFAEVSFAQKKEIAEAKTYLKSGKNLDKAESLMRNVIAMPEQKSPLDNHLLLAEIVRKRYEASNELLYLKQLKDTAEMFNVLHRLFAAYETLDSLDAMPDKKGVVRPRYREKNAEYLNRFRPNLYKAGMYFVRHRDMTNAYKFMDAYLDCHRQPLFAAKDYARTDTVSTEAAHWAVVAAHRQKNHDGVGKYRDWALRHDAKAHITLTMLYQDYLEAGDTVTAISYLRKGFNEHPEHHFFFPRLVDYYASVNHLDTVCEIVNRACSLEPGNLFYRLARNTIQLNMGQYDECIALGDSLIHNNDKMSEAYMNVGTAYFNKALLRDRQGKETKEKRSEVNAYYEKAMPYIERYRLLRPRRQKQWAPMLYTIYLNLNLGDKFDEIDNLLKRGQ